MSLDQLEFESRVDGKFVENHRNNKPVWVSRVKGRLGNGFEALIFTTHVHLNFDGDPRAYAPPISATEWWPSNNLRPRSLIGNATSVHWNRGDTFHPTGPTDLIQANQWHWTGVQFGQSARGAMAIDSRPFLKDLAGNYPLFNPPGPDREYYAPRGAINTSRGLPVNPIENACAALSNELKTVGGVRLGDFGLAMRTDGKSTPYIYTDAGGGASKSVGEVSPRLAANLFGGRVTGAVTFIVFPNSRRVSNIAEPERMTEVVRTRIEQLRPYTNRDELLKYLAFPMALEVLKSWGFVPQERPPVPLNKNIF